MNSGNQYLFNGSFWLPTPDDRARCLQMFFVSPIRSPDVYESYLSVTNNPNCLRSGEYLLQFFYWSIIVIFIAHVWFFIFAVKAVRPTGIVKTFVWLRWVWFIFYFNPALSTQYYKKVFLYKIYCLTYMYITLHFIDGNIRKTFYDHLIFYFTFFT